VFVKGREHHLWKKLRESLSMLLPATLSQIAAPASVCGNLPVFFNKRRLA
jgi:hypothetical protein